MSAPTENKTEASGSLFGAAGVQSPSDAAVGKGSVSGNQQHEERGRRCAALLRRWTSGKKLTPPEMSEIQHLLPPGILANPPAASTSYRHAYDFYATALGCDVRNIKRYVQIGRAISPEPELPPFDDPPAFLGWWQRRMKHAPNERVLAYARSATPPAGSASATSDAARSATSTSATADASRSTTPVAASGATPPAGTPPAPPLGFAFAGVGGFENSVIELRATTAAAQDRLRRAMNAIPHDESLVTSCTTAVSKQLELLRKAENDLFDMQQKRGELLPRTEVREDWRTLLAALRQMRERMADNIVAHLSTLAAFTPEALSHVRAAVLSERLREDQLLRGSVHWRQSPDA